MLSRLAIRRRVTTMMITMMVFLAGIVSYMNLDMNLMPEMDIPIVVVSTTYVGAGPEEIENLVTKPLGIPQHRFQCRKHHLRFVGEHVPWLWYSL